MAFLSPEKKSPALPEVPDFREPTDGSLRYRSYGAMPANPYADEAIRARQQVIRAEFKKLYSYTDGLVPRGVAAMMQADYDINEERRSLKTFDAYMSWLNTHQPVSPEIEQNLNFMERGAALPDELLDIGLHTNIESVELGKVTHPYGRRLVHVYGMRDDVKQAMDARGAMMYPAITPYRSIDIHPFTSYHTGMKAEKGMLQGFIASYKHDLGQIPTDDPTVVLRVVERQIAGFRVDEASGFPQDKLQRLLDSRADVTKEHSDTFQRQMRESGVRGCIERAIQMDLLDDYVIPQSTTIYAFRDHLSAEELDPKFDMNRITNVGAHGLALVKSENAFKRVA